MSLNKLILISAGFLLLSTKGFAQQTPSLSIPEAIELYNQSSSNTLPALSRRQLRRLQNDKTVQIKHRVKINNDQGRQTNARTINAYRIINQPRLLTWLATIQSDVQHSKRLTEHQITQRSSEGSVWYQFLDLPWPFKNRHWVIRNRNATQLSKASGDLIWEHNWTLESRGSEMVDQLISDNTIATLKPKKIKKAIYLPANNGRWIMIPLGAEKTLVIANTQFDMGGWIPDRVVAGFISEQLDDILDKIEPRCRSIASEYDGHLPVYTGMGQLITKEMVAKAWAGELDNVGI